MGEVIMASDVRGFIDQVEAVEQDALERATRMRATGNQNNGAEFVLALLAPLLVALATGLTTLAQGKSEAAGVVGLIATVVTALNAGWSPGRRASRNWLLHADFMLIAGRASDLRVVHATYLPLEEGARRLDELRKDLATAIRSPHAQSGSK